MRTLDPMQVVRQDRCSMRESTQREAESCQLCLICKEKGTGVSRRFFFYQKIWENTHTEIVRYIPQESIKTEREATLRRIVKRWLFPITLGL